MLLQALLLAVSTPAPIAPQTATDFVAEFKSICFTPFPSPDAYRVAIAASGYEAVASMPPGEKWRRGAISLSYLSGQGLPTNLPNPQCAMKFSVPLGQDHLSMAATLEKQLGISGGKSQGKRGSNRTTWNFDTAGGEHLRMFFSSEIKGESLEMNVTLLRLRK